MPVPEKEAVTKVCIDDFAFRKRKTYGTIMVDIDTHRIIDLLASREAADVAEWLKSYPNLEVVSRDGSVSYKSAIEQAGSHLQQVSDRFHLVKGLTDAAKKFLSRLLAANFILPTEASHYDGKPTGDYWDKPVKEDAPAAEHNANVKKKMKTVEQVREFGKQGLNKSEIARIVGINRVTVAKYLKDDFNPSSAYYHTTIPSKIKPYSQEIKNMLSEGKTFKQISAVIRERGYDGADGTIRMFATRERRLMKEAAEQGGSGEKIERKWLISLLYHPVDEVRSLSQDQLDRIIEEYPIIGRVYDAVTGFKGALFGKKEAELDKWAKETEALEIDELESFINGIKRDIIAVKNAIRLDYNNGLAEGSVNKLKVVKRIMYGRNSFELLKGKLLRLELRRKIN